MTETPAYPSDPSQEQIVSIDSLKELMVKVLVKKGMFAVEAEMVADRLIDADLRGIDSHGCRSLPRYIESMDLGDIDPRATSLTMVETAAIAVIDAGKGVGHVAATRAMQLAIKKAKEVGTGTVAIKKGQHFGAASVYSLLATQEGMIGYCTTSTGGATVAAYGSREPAIANNAFAWGVPTRDGAPFVLDMACGMSSWGKIHSMQAYGGSMPEGWCLDAEGNPTADFDAIKTMLPAAGARGFGLGFVSGALAGALVNRKMPIHKDTEGSPESYGSEHFFYAIDVAQFGDIERFYDEVDSSIADIQALTPAEGFDKVRIPGELEWEHAEERRANGLPLHKDSVKLMNDLAAGLKVDASI